MREKVTVALLSVGLVGSMMVLGANVYQAVVEIPNWTRTPEALADFRACVRHSHPGYFFQVLVPTTLLSLVGATVAGWNRPRGGNRWLLGAIGGVLAAELFTVAYFFPRNAILFFEPLGTHGGDVMAQAAVEWSNAHIVRMLTLVCGAVSAARAFFVIARTAPE